jgi:hypothetical protein
MARTPRFARLLPIVALLPALAFAGDSLSLVPPDAVSVGVANIAQFRNSPLAGKLFAQADRMTVDGEAAKLLAETGLKPAEDIDVVTFALSPKEGDATSGEALVLVEGRFDPDRIGAAMVARGAVRKSAAAGVWYILPNEHQGEHGSQNGAVAFLRKGLLVAGTEASVIETLGYARNGGSSFLAAGALAPEISRVDPKASAWMIVDVPRMTRLKKEPAWQGDNDHPAQGLVQSMRRVSTVALWTTEGGDELSFGVLAVSGDAETRQLLEDAARGMLATWRLAASEKDPQLVNVIRGFAVKQDGNGVSLTGTITGETLRKFTERHKQGL